MKKTVSIILVIICALSLAACGEPEVKSNRLEKTASSIAAALPSAIDLSDLDCLTNEDDRLGQLEFIYGVTTDNMEKIDSYFVTNSHRSTDARAVAVIFFKEGTEASVIESVKTQIQDVFVKNLVNYTANYDPEQSKIAAAASFKVYDNALAFASYDTNGNTVVFDAIEK